MTDDDYNYIAIGQDIVPLALTKSYGKNKEKETTLKNCMMLSLSDVQGIVAEDKAHEEKDVHLSIHYLRMSALKQDSNLKRKGISLKLRRQQ